MRLLTLVFAVTVVGVLADRTLQVDKARCATHDLGDARERAVAAAVQEHVAADS
jgi:hypothetical protein